MQKRDDDVIIGALRACTTRSQIENIFNRFEIPEKDLEIRTSLLLNAMGDPEVFFSVGSPTEQEKYELIIQMFLSMTWKYSLMRKGINC